ncbi:uncharacterized protein LOC129593442 isoform X2 [Paramacrobiotus metropolitanus]|uniref:uncharacterized protein LOC129593442 isoform X2 n=1 Tax=Paramacrobiotus metropolitanus TaxID=2943436 RepID=UPI002445F5F7|nr:uncharacterized protein LOC129593442 isoform X2 [Paramacrobiotus metropolitanus]
MSSAVNVWCWNCVGISDWCLVAFVLTFFIFLIYFLFGLLHPKGAVQEDPSTALADSLVMDPVQSEALAFPHLAHVNGQRGSTPEGDSSTLLATTPVAAPVRSKESSAEPFSDRVLKQQAVAEALASANMVDSLDVQFAIKSLENGSGDASTPTLVSADTYSQDVARAVSSEVFGENGLDFLENAGSTNAIESELARQSLYQKFDPYVAETAPSRPLPEPAFKRPFPPQSSTANLDMIAAMQHKRDAILRQQQQSQSTAETQPAQLCGIELAQTQTLDNSIAPPMNGGGGQHAVVNGNGMGGEDDENENADEQPIPTYPPGSLVSLSTPPQRPVTLRTKNAKMTSNSVHRTLNRRSVPAGVFAEGEHFKLAMEDSQPSNYSGLPDLPPVWENVVAMYEGVVQTLLAKLKTFQEETAAAKQREARAIADQEEMHRVFVSLHERFETSKSVISTYKSNQEILQRAYDELNAEFAPQQQEMKRVQAVNRMVEMKNRQLEDQLEKKKEEIAEMAKIVDDLISGSKEG